MDKKKVVSTFTFLLLMMVLFAVIDSTRGIFFPVFKGEFNLSNFQLSLLLASSYTGFLIFTSIAGILCGRIGHKKVLLIGLIIIAAAMFIMGTLHFYYALLVGMFLASSGGALINLGVNTLVPLLFISLQGLFMNLAHFSYGVGATATQRFTGIFLYKGVSFNRIYMFVGIAATTLALVFALVKVPEVGKKKESEGVSIVGYIRNKTVILYILILSFYVVAEHGTSNWLVTYLQNQFAFDSNRSSYYVSMFFIFLTLGRLAGAVVAQRFGEFRVLKIYFALAFVLYLSGLIMGDKWLIMISISGFFFSIIYPTTIYSINKIFKERSAYVTSIVISLSTVFDIAANFLMGVLNDLIGYSSTFFIMPLALILGLVCVVMVQRNVSKEAIEISI